MAGHDHVTPHNFEVSIVGQEGSSVRATVWLNATIPVGGIELDVLYDPHAHRLIEVSPWRNLGQFVLAELDRQAQAALAS